MKKGDPIFIHSQWRTVKTALWAALREDSVLRCYYEPFHEVLSTLSTSRAHGAPETSHFNLAHPSLQFPRFAEFAPLIGKLGGVSEFRPRFSYEDFALPESASDIDLKNYLDTLISSAELDACRPVLAFSRSTLRVGWMRRHVRGFHLGVVRHPHRQWASYKRLANSGNRYFQAVTLLTFFNTFSESLGLGEYSDVSMHNWFDINLMWQACVFCKESDVYFAFYVIWLLGGLHLDRYADCVVNLDTSENEHLNRLRDVLAEQGVTFDPSRFGRDGGDWMPEGAEAIEIAARAWLAERARTVLPDDEFSKESSRNASKGLIDSDVERHLGFPEVSSTAVRQAEERVERLTEARETALVHLLRWKMAGPSAPFTVADRSFYQWSPTQLRRMQGCELRAHSTGIGLACDSRFAMVNTFSPPVPLPAATYRVEVCLGNIAGERENMYLGFQVGRQSGNGDEYLAREYRRFNEGDGDHWISVGCFELGQSRPDTVVGLFWAAKNVVLMGLRLVCEPEDAAPRGRARSVAEAPDACGAFPRHLDFSAEGNAANYMVHGFHPPEADGCWTRAGQADLALPAPGGLPAVTRVRMNVRGLNHRLLRPVTRITLFINGLHVGEEQLTSNNARRVCWTLPKLATTNWDGIWLSLTVDDLVSPWALGHNRDRRMLGIRLFWLALDEDEETE